MYVFVFAVLIPVSLVLAQRQLVRIDRAEGTAVAILNLGASALLIVIARSAWFVGGASAVSFAFLGGGVAICIANSNLCLRTVAAAGHSDRRRNVLETVTAVLVVAALLSFFPSAFFTPARILACLVVAAGLCALYLGRAVVKPGKRVRGTLDGLIVLTTVLLVIDVRDYGDHFRYDYDYFLGPANAIAHGHAMLVDTFSQYGVGLPLALAGAFQVVPLSYGGLQIILSVGYAVEFTLVYIILRLACRSQFIAVTGLAVAMVGNLVLPGLSRMAYPSVGPLRFGIPWLIVVFCLLATSHSRFRRTYEAAALCTLGVAAIWSFETMIYATGTYLMMAAVGSALREGSRSSRLKAFAGYLAVAAAVIVSSILAFTLLSRVIVSAWPDWGTYLGLIGRYSVQEFGTLLIPSWSVGYAIASVYVISTLGLVVTIATGTGAPVKQTSLLAIAGATAFGALSFTYFLGRSEPTNLHHIAIPAVVVVCCWADLLVVVSASSRRVVVISTACLVSLVGSAVLTQSPKWTSAWINASPLAQGIRSPSMVMSEGRRLLANEPGRPEVVAASRTLARYDRPGRPVAVLLHSDLLTSVLLASGTGNALAIVNGNQDRLTGERARKLVRRSIARMQPGSFVLTEDVFLRRPSQSFAAKGPPVAGDRRFGDYFIALTLGDLRKQFETHVVTRGPNGLVVLELVRRIREPETSPS